MAHAILMPKAGQSMTEGTVVTWFKKEGDQVQTGDALLEIETDKANLDVEALESGVLRKVFVQEGESCPVLAVIGVIGGAEEEIDFDAVRAEGQSEAAAEAPAPQKPTAPAKPAPKPAAPKAAAPRPRPASTPAVSAAPIAVAATTSTPSAGSGHLPPAARTATGRRVAASPLARRLASERGVDLATLRGTGPGGRIIRRDVETAPASARNGGGAVPGETTAPYPPPSARPDAEVPLTGMRGAIASALQQSKQTIPHFYTTMAIDMSAALGLKAAFAAAGTRLTVNDLILRAVTLALLDEPAVNCRVHEDRVEYPESVNLGVAVGSDAGLVVPVVLDAQALDLGALAGETRRVIELAQQGKLVGSGRGTFTVSNLGMFGVESFTAIINPPEGAILAVGGIHQELVPVGGGFFPKPILRVTLSCDHRAVDGLLAARFLQRLKHLLEAGRLG